MIAGLLRLVGLGPLGWLAGLGKAAVRLFDAFCNYPWQMTTLALTLLAAVEAHHIANLNNDLDEAAALVASIRGAQATALQNQVAVNQAPAIASIKIAEKSHVDTQKLYEAGRLAGAAYAAAHRVRGDAACPIGGAGLPGADYSARQHDEAGAAGELVAIGRTDFDTCTINTVRLAKVHQDAAALIAVGAAQAAD